MISIFDLEQSQKYQLEDLIFDLTEIQSSDILVNADLTKKELCEVAADHRFEFPLSPNWNALLKTTIQNKRQSDTNTLCLAQEGIDWEYKGKKIISPLLLIPVTYKINKVKQEIHFTPDMENAIFNPFVKNELMRRYDLSWNEPIGFSQKSSDFFLFLEKHAFQFEKVSLNVFGNFHHHRYQIVKDLEALTRTELNPLVQEMLGNPVASNPEKLHLTRENIVPADKDQKAVFKQIESGNLLIQGPPGTGKSQVLTNLLAKLLDKGNMNLVVSEKKAALDVLVKKLKPHGLDAFAFIAHNQVKPGDFIAQLKKTWNLLENKTDTETKNLLLSEQLLAQLQLTLDKLTTKNLVGGIGFSEFQQLMQAHDLSETPLVLDVPSVATWLEEKTAVLEIYHALSSFEVLKHFNQKGIAEGIKLDAVFVRLTDELLRLTKTLDFHTFEALENRIKQLSRCQIIENESYKKYASLFSSKKDRKKFDQLRLDFIQQSETLSLLESETAIWTTRPSLSLATSWKIQLSESWWKRRKAEKQIKDALSSKAILPNIAVENWLRYLAQEETLQNTISALHKLGIERPKIELESISYLLGQLEKEDQNELNEAMQIPDSLRKKIIVEGNALQAIYRELKSVINLDPSDHIIETLRTVKEQLPQILPVQQMLATLSADTFRLIQKSASPEEMEKLVLKGNWFRFTTLFPELSKFDGDSLKSSIAKIIDTEREEHTLFGTKLRVSQHTKFDQFHQLLRLPAAKLKADEKIRKASLKAGKAILVKEFAKTKQHKTIRELLDSDARAWIEILTPIWLSTPQQVASIFPMEEALFECVIFDEASQIPLSHALGSLQRAKQAVVAGDEQQMSPGNYFSGNSSGIDLLHQANYYWNKVPLKHHYRSAHPELIAFSNQYFYNNELIAYPSAKREEEPLSFHFIPDGVYDERQNIEEAKIVAKQIAMQVNKTGTFGVVAFSEQQLNCIWNQIEPEIQNKLNELTDKGKVFFKALEQVQGDECDYLIISMGYGKNPEGEFHARFGPLNQKNGYKRLNVLLTRAKKSIDFYTSIKSSDLNISTNESVNLLRLFLSKAEQENNAHAITFPFGLNPTMKGNQLIFENLPQQLADAEELVTLQAVLEERGWKLQY